VKVSPIAGVAGRRAVAGGAAGDRAGAVRRLDLAGAHRRDPAAWPAAHRTPGQRRDDALEDAAKRLLRTGELPTTAGVVTTLMITTTLDQLESRAGQATTQHGGSISIPEALRLAPTARPCPWCSTRRRHPGLRSRPPAGLGQRLALMARDKGCLPRCRETASRSEVHHITDWAKGGRTDTDQLALACGYHNTDAILQGWYAIMLDGVPRWVPPPHIDPTSTPTENPNATASTSDRPPTQ
jgi:hypothetical protein